MFINSASAISPQASFKQMMEDPANYSCDQLSCIEPDYTRYADSKQIRRMSRIIKMGVAAASEALQVAKINMPDAIITGTAYGCLADTDQFLTRLVEFKETLLSPTAFIQSTHNTVGAQIALLLQCHNYNTTYVHRGSSFEAALTDALLMLREGDAATVLVGATDEITIDSHAILKRFGLYKRQSESLKIMNSGTKGTMAGEGAAFFVVSEKQNNHSLARIVACKNYYTPATSATTLIDAFLNENNISAHEIDLIITGKTGDSRFDAHYDEPISRLFPHNEVISYKQYCGEYPTSSAFALWMTVNILKEKIFNNKPAGKVLIYNNYMLRYPSLYLLSAC